MDIPFRRSFFRSGKPRFSGRHDLYQAAQKLFESPHDQLKLRFLGFLLLSLALGFQAYSRAREIAKNEWLKENPPSLRTWNAFILQRGFQEVSDAEVKSNLLSTLPYGVKPENELNLAEDGRALALSRPEGTFFFYRGSKPPTPNPLRKIAWEKLGMSWEAVAALQEKTFYGETGNIQKPSKKEVSRGAEIRDPKRIVY